MSRLLVGVISDTHVTNSGRRALPPRLWDDFAGVEMILHAGDLTSPRVISELETIAPVFAVAGNNDSSSLGLPQSRRLELGGVVVGMAHGDRFAPSTCPRTGAETRRPPANLPYQGNAQTSAFALSYVPDAQVMIFGHSHRPLIARATLGGDGVPKRRVLLLNPGSPTDKRWSHHFGVALLEIQDGAAHAHALLW